MVDFFVCTLSSDWGALLLRLVIGLALLPYAVQKLSQISKPPQFPAPLGLSPHVAFYLAMIVETSCSVCMILGLFTRLMAIPGICNMAVAYKVAHAPHFIANSLPFLLGFIAILIMGPGAFSLDYLIFK